MSTLPEPGPERDRAVAELLGAAACPYQGTGVRENRGGTVSEFCVLCGNPYGSHRPDYPYSTEPGVALAALEVWRLRAEGRRSWQLASPDPDHERWTVALWWLTDDEFPVSAESTDQPTLPAAVTAALLATRGNHA